MSLSLGRGSDTLHETIQFLVESVLCLVAAGKSGGVCTDDCDMSEGLSRKRSFINRSLTDVGSSGSCLQSEILMASATPCILSSSFAFPFQKNVHPPFDSAIEPSSASLVSLLLLLLLIFTAFKGKTASRGRLASFGFGMSFV